MIELTRRKALFGLLAAPAIIRTPGLLMPIKQFEKGPYYFDPSVDFSKLSNLNSAQWLVETMQEEIAKALQVPKHLLFGVAAHNGVYYPQG